MTRLQSPTTPTFDREAAAEFLAASRSRFLQEAGRWLMAFDDPAELLILLSGEVGQHLGPWDCYRHCALLGLHHSGAVKSLALDVLSEAPGDDDTPPIAPALALAWALDGYPEEEAPHRSAWQHRLDTRTDEPRAHSVLIAAASLALSASNSTEADRLVQDRCGDVLLEALASAEAATLAVPIWEATMLAHHALAEKSYALVVQSQASDGGSLALADHQLVRGFATLRALALDSRRTSSLAPKGA